MINTYNIKQEQLKTGSFKIGSGAETILIVGSCRSVPYLNYLNLYNSNNRFTIHFIDPFNWNWDINDRPVNYEEVIQSMETNENILNILRTTKIYIHEYYVHFGMFNSSPDAEKNIYQYGLKPELDICVPNFNDLFIFFNDILTFDVELQAMAKADLAATGILQPATKEAIKTKGLAAMEKFYSICRMSSIPEMEDHFKNNYKTTRFFWTSNHISKWFSLAIFRIMNDKFLKLELNDYFWNAITSERDLYETPSTPLTIYDVEAYNFNWNEPLKDLMV